MNNIGKLLVLFCFSITLGVIQYMAPEAMAQSSYFSARGCTMCHSAPTTATCAGCHQHSGTLSATKNKTTAYAPGETVSITLTASGARSGWIGVRLYDQNGTEIARSSGNQSGMGGSATYPATVSAPAPATAGTYTWKISYFGNQNGTGSGDVHGEKSVNVSITVAAAADTTAPVVSTFTLPASATSLTVPVSAFTASDDTAVTGYLVTTTATAPTATAAGWSATAPTTVTAPSAGTVTFYAWAKDAAGNVSLAKSATVTITLPVVDTTAPVVNIFTLPASATSLTVPVSAFTASDNTAVTGYQITTSATAPSATGAGWSATAPATVTAPAAGTVTFYAWAKDAASNVSLAKSATVTITLPAADTTAPIVDTFILPATSESLTVVVTALTASDNVGVTGYQITGSATAPSASAAGWSTTAPASVTASAAGTATFYAWAKDAAGNVSLAKSAAVTITLPTGGDNPVLSVSTLEDGAVTRKPTLNVTGSAVDPDGIKSVTLNGKKAKIKADGSFTAMVKLKPGSNTVTVVATDSKGNQSVDSRTVTYDKEAPLLAVETPVDHLKTSESFITVSGSISEQATVTVSVNNGAAEFAAVNGNSFTATVYLVSGVNTLIIKATDLAGNSSSMKRTVFCDDGKPFLAVTSPEKDMTTKKDSLMVKGKAKGADDDLSVTITMGDATYNPTVMKGKFAQLLTFPAPGEYDIVITATDANGSSSVHRIVSYQPEVNGDDDDGDDD
jgi:hypothetical protein